MFHSRTGLLAATATLFCLTAQPIYSHASEAKAPAAQTHTQPTNKTSVSLKDMSIADMRRNTRDKISGTKQWVKDQPAIETTKGFFQDMEKATDRLQDRVSPVGNKVKASVRGQFPGKSAATQADKRFSTFGIILMMAFGFVVFLLGVSGPMSRLGGRH